MAVGLEYVSMKPSFMLSSAAFVLRMKLSAHWADPAVDSLSWSVRVFQPVQFVHLARVAIGPLQCPCLPSNHYASSFVALYRLAGSRSNLQLFCHWRNILSQLLQTLLMSSIFFG
jgi:hypothetical protein